MIVTDEIFSSFLHCETKSYLKHSGTIQPQSEIPIWKQSLTADYKTECSTRLHRNFPENECLINPKVEILKDYPYRLFIDCAVHAQGLQSRIHAMERVTASGKGEFSPLIPIRFIPYEKLTKHDKLLLAFDAFVFSAAFGKLPPFGKIIHGTKQKTVKIQLPGLMETIKAMVSRITAQKVDASPKPVLKKHCAECEFQSACRLKAVQSDDLSLLAGMSEKERKQLHAKGIFTVTQLSYTFRPRRKPKRAAAKPVKSSSSLKALAIRENKIHIAGKPELNLSGTPVFLDVEGVPDRDFYYLVGIRIKTGDSYIHHSFWADEESEEKKIWFSFLNILREIDSPRLIYYGSYETVFLKRMKAKYGVGADDSSSFDQIVIRSINILSVIYAQIYFPTYSNGLKDIARYFGFRWSDDTASGFKSLIWRSRWESSKALEIKEKLSLTTRKIVRR